MILSTAWHLVHGHLCPICWAKWCKTGSQASTVFGPHLSMRTCPAYFPGMSCQFWWPRSGCARPWGSVKAPAVTKFQKPSPFQFQPATLWSADRWPEQSIQPGIAQAIKVFYELEEVKTVDRILTGFRPVYKKPLHFAISLPKSGCQGARFWTPAPAPRTPWNMLLMKCLAIAAGQVS